ncbi:MAG: GNAT family N-acetyltransferase [Pseudomonadota bacterium]
MAGRFVQDIAELTRLGEAWNTLCLSQPRPTPMLTWDWADAWWRVYGAPNRNLSLSVWVYEENGKVLGLFPLYRIDTGHGAVFRPIGTGEREEDAVCSDYIAPLFAGSDEGVKNALTSDLAALLTRGSDTLLLSDLASEDPWNVSLAETLRSRPLSVRRTGGSTCAYLPLPKTYDEFFSSLSSNFRTQLRQGERSLKALGGVEFHRIERTEDIGPFWEDLVRLHQKRWNAVGRPGVFSSPLFTEFHREIVERYTRRGWLDGLVLYTNGQPMAVVYSYRIGGTIFLYQSGLETELPPKVRPGLQLHLEVIRQGIVRGDREYDFMRGDDRYKKQFTESSRSLFHVEAGRPTPRRTLRFLSISARERIKGILPDSVLRSIRTVRRSLRSRSDP